MGCSSSNLSNQNDSGIIKYDHTLNDGQDNNILDEDQPDINENQYHNYKFKIGSVNNLLLFTTLSNGNSEFFSNSEKMKEKTEKYSFKSMNHSLAVGYRKGYKLEFKNQDKFFVLIDHSIEVFCLLDGHGPFGHVLAQIIQDNIFKQISSFQSDDFESQYDRYLTDIFNFSNEVALEKNNNDTEEYGEYDSFLSGAAVTLIIRYKNDLYCANVGNVLALVYSYDKLMPSKSKATELTGNDSEFDEKIIMEDSDKNEHSDKTKSSNLGKLNYNHQNDENNFEFVVEKMWKDYMISEIRRIYEHGGELKKLQGENNTRIFVRGKYFPGCVNTRSLGDQIGKGIGIIAKPHISKIALSPDNSDFLILCTDGISNSCPSDKIISMLNPNNESCIFFLIFLVLLESVLNIISESRSVYKTHIYSPDATILIKEIKYDTNL